MILIKHFIIIVRYKRLKDVFVLTLAIAILFLFIFYFHWDFKGQDDLTVFKMQASLASSDHPSENLLASIFPMDDKVLYENPYRLYDGYVPTYKTYALEDALEGGDELGFEKVVDEPSYLRPIYNSIWKDAYFRSWLYFPYKMSEARHKLFIYYGGASNIYDFEGSLGIDLGTGINVDYHRNINFLVYHFNVDRVISYENQIVLSGTPSEKGLQIISVKVNDLLPKDQDSKEFLFQLSTPGGYEIDYYYGNYERSDYLKRLQEEEAIMTFSFSPSHEVSSQQLKKELSMIIPLEDNIILTEQECRKSNISLVDFNVEMIVTQGKEIKYHLLYQDVTYKRPLYNPIWKENVEKGWGYLPNKMCENMQQLFILPCNAKDQSTYLQSLGFHENIPTLPSGNVGFLLYNFLPLKVIKIDEQIAILGTPSRTGATIILLSSDVLDANSTSDITLSTPDYFVLEKASF